MLQLQRLLRNPNEPGALGNQNRYGFRWENQKASEECEKSSGQRGIVQKNSSKNGLIARSLWFLDGESFFSFLLSLHLTKIQLKYRCESTHRTIPFHAVRGILACEGKREQRAPE